MTKQARGRQVRLAELKNEREEARHKSALTIHSLTEITGLIGRAFGYGTILGCAYFIADAAKALAGKQTDANFALFVELFANKWVPWTISALLGLGFGYQTIAKNRLAKRLTPYPKELEQRIDRRRSSSGLGPTGQPKKG